MINISPSPSLAPPVTVTVTFLHFTLLQCIVESSSLPSLLPIQLQTAASGLVSPESCDPDIGLELTHPCSPNSPEIRRGKAKATSDELHCAELNAASFRRQMCPSFYCKSPHLCSFKHLYFQENKLVLYKFSHLLLLSKSQSILCRAKYSLPVF